MTGPGCTVDAVAHCFTDVIIQAMNLAIPQVPLDSTNSQLLFSYIDLLCGEK